MKKSIIVTTDFTLKPQSVSVLDYLDAKESTIKDYKYRIPMFVSFLEKNGFDSNSYLSYKRTLAERTDITVATKNKYLITAKVFLRELNKRSEIPDITQNIKTFKESKKHKRDGLNEASLSQSVAILVGLKVKKEL